MAIPIPRCGKVVVVDGQLTAVRRRWWPGKASSLRIWFDSNFRHSRGDCCILHYSGSRAQPGYLTVDYIRSHQGTTLQTLRGSLLVLDQIASQRQAVAIFAHVGTSAISDRLLRRWGWEPHAGRIAGRHWIKRFYEGFPDVDMSHLGPLAEQLKQSRAELVSLSK
jgi:hypothetical protein